MIKINNLAIIVWTHSSYNDCWNIFFDNLDKYASNIKVYVMTNKSINRKNVHEFIYDEDYEFFTTEYLKYLEKIPEKYIIHLQEDFILYDKINYQNIKRYVNILDTTKYNFVRLIRSGMNNKLIPDENNTNLFINQENNFVLQPTIWDKKIIKVMFSNNPVKRIGGELEKSHRIKILLKMDLFHGLFSFNNEKKRGQCHWDSTDFPYMATAINRGKWNWKEYHRELKPLLLKYNIDVNTRGKI